MINMKKCVGLYLLTVITQAPFSAAMAESETFGKCLLEIDNKIYIKGRCPINMENDGGFSIRSSEKRSPYFAMVNITGRNRAEGSWNGEEGASHAHESLGDLVKSGACWENERAKVCAWQ